MTTAKGYKITDAERKTRVGIAVRNFDELKKKTIDKFKLSLSSAQISFQTPDGTMVESEDYFQTLPAQTLLIWVKSGERAETDAEILYKTIREVNEEYLNAGEKVQEFFTEKMKNKVFKLAEVLKGIDAEKVKLSDKSDHPEWFEGIRISALQSDNMNYRNSYKLSADREAFREAHLAEDPYEASRQVVHRGYTRNRGFRGNRGSSSRGNYNKSRVASYRKQNSKITELDLADSLNKKYFPGIKDPQDAMNQIEATQTFKTSRLTITTRQIGFGCVNIFMGLRGFNNVPVQGNIYQMYRVFLAMTETKVVLVNRGIIDLQLHSSDFTHFNNDENFLITAQSLLAVPEPISDVINAIGIVTTNGRKYVPGIGRANFTGGHLFIPQSEQITYSNLRQTAEALANNATPAEYRRRFYRNNPIPGAVWQGAPENPVLMNADEIIPADYNLGNLINDIEDVQVKLNFMSRKAKKHSELVRYETEGTKSMLTCNCQESIRIDERNPGEALNEYERRVKMYGDITSYWNLEKLGAKEMVNGALCLLGELPNSIDLEYPVYILRNERVGVEVSNLQYRATVLKYS